LLDRALSTARETDSAFFLRWMVLGLPRLLSVALSFDVQRDFAESMIRRWEIPPPGPTAESWPWPLRIRVLGPFELLKDGVPVKYARKTPTRLLELLKLVAARGGTEVPVDYICSQLWPDSDGDAADAAFTNALHRVRKRLGRENALVLRQGRLSLDGTICHVDLCAFRTLCDEVRREGAIPTSDMNRTLERAEKIFRLYRGHLLAEEPYPWVIELRDKARHGFAESIRTMGRQLEQGSHWENAATLYRRAIEIDGLVEPFYLRLMVCLRELGRTGEACEAFRDLRKTLSIVLGLTPSQETSNVYQSLGARK
jgi:DNA-binding SARP family transcriptional activator